MRAWVRVPIIGIGAGGPHLRTTTRHCVLVLSSLALLAALSCQPARAVPSARPAAAEDQFGALEAEVEAARSELASARARLKDAQSGAASADKLATESTAQLEGLEDSANTRQHEAVAQIAGLDARHAEEVEEHDERIARAIGLGLALFVAALIAFGWETFRGSAAVAWLADRDRSRAIGICVGAGLLAVAVGASVSGTGLVGVLASALASLGLILPTALLLGRHSVQGQSSGTGPTLRRERPPRALALAAAFGALCLGSILYGRLSAGPDPIQISPKVEVAAAPLTKVAKTEIGAASSRAGQLGDQAQMLDEERASIHAEINHAKAVLEAAEDNLASAEKRAGP